MGWITITSPLVCLGFVVWLYKYFKGCYINKLINELQELNDTMLDMTDTINEYVERTR